MAYAAGNPKTKKALREMVAKGPVPVIWPGFHRGRETGEEAIEGPHSPEPHRWHARCELRDGMIVRVIS